MAEESIGQKTDPTIQDKKAPTTKNKKICDTADKNAEKRKDETPTPEGQKRVTKDYRSGWKRIWGSKK